MSAGHFSCSDWVTFNTSEFGMGGGGGGRGADHDRSSADMNVESDYAASIFFASFSLH